MEHAFDDAEGVLHAAADLGLDTITGAFDLVYDALVPSAAVGKVLCLGACGRGYRSGPDKPSRPTPGSPPHGADRAGPWRHGRGRQWPPALRPAQPRHG